MTPNHTKILYALNIGVVCLVVVLFLFQIYGVKLRDGDFFTLGASSLGDPTTSESVVVVGDPSDRSETNRFGRIVQLSGSSLTLKDLSSGKLYTVSISFATRVELIGAPKDPATYQKELDAYYAQAKLLTQDPVKNKDALAALVLPQSNEVTSGSIADLAVGDTIGAKSDEPITNTSFVAIKIGKILPQER